MATTAPLFRVRLRTCAVPGITREHDRRRGEVTRTRDGLANSWVGTRHKWVMKLPKPLALSWIDRRGQQPQKALVPLAHGSLPRGFAARLRGASRLALPVHVSRAPFGRPRSRVAERHTFTPCERWGRGHSDDQMNASGRSALPTATVRGGGAATRASPFHSTKDSTTAQHRRQPRTSPADCDARRRLLRFSSLARLRRAHENARQRAPPHYLLVPSNNSALCVTQPLCTTLSVSGQ